MSQHREPATEKSAHQVTQEVLREMLSLPKIPPDLACSRRLIESPHHGGHGVVGTLYVNMEDAHQVEMAPKKGDTVVRTVPIETQADKPTLESKVKRLEDSVKDANERLDVVDVRLDELETKGD
ncbi:hypothetical protein V6N13_082078 [Hibiscus sabdariffa]